MYTEFKDLIGKTLTSVRKIENDEILFTCETGEVYRMWHSQDCCESVSIADINGDLQALIGHPIQEAEERTNDTDKPSEYAESFLWTFYTIRTIKETVVIRWLGESNGYYSESVDFGLINQATTL